MGRPIGSKSSHYRGKPIMSKKEIHEMKLKCNAVYREKTREKRKLYDKNRYWYNKINNTDFHKKELERKRKYSKLHFNKEYQNKYRKENPHVFLNSYLKSLKKQSIELSLDLPKYTRALKNWSRYIRNRDIVCVICNSDKKLNSHHLIYKSLYPKLSLNTNNGITLCETCHYQTHGQRLHWKVM